MHLHGELFQISANTDYVLDIGNIISSSRSWKVAEIVVEVEVVV